MILSSDQLHSLIESHSRQIVQKMSIDELRAYAVEKTIAEFLDYTGNIDKYTEATVFNDILEQEDGDTDSVFEFMVGDGIPDDVVDKVIQHYMA
jgi:hypothetical protein